MEKALLQAHALIESTVSLHRTRPVPPSSVARTDAARIGDTLEQLVRRARHSVCVALTGTGEFADAVLKLLATIPPRVVVRVLCTSEAAGSPLITLTEVPDRRVEVRVSESDLREILVVDGSVALVRAAGSAGEQAALVNDAAAVRALELLFAGAWSRGRKLADHLHLSPRLRTELARNILERLRAGNTDEIAARDLNVSLRTYRRHVADIMRELDANSRFQAGVRAVEFGLLAE
ncbi:MULTISPECIES: DNA-binding response regulator [unclassified Streptomyces]|uniref:DNA-binding response regulator n=1 Tax=unclassified Streptomyces TaxID=2593676 RepID=UPI0029A6DD4F|nr:DNA-binding response regulator [Streptomyces sp. DK15]MDX2396332.1 DNA-binding response regulator [Streptomyces sp. DK15]